MIRATQTLKNKIIPLIKSNKTEEAIKYIQHYLSVSRKQAKRYYNYINEGIVVDTEIPVRKKASISYDNCEAIADSVDENVRTLDQLLAACKVDLNIWEVDKYSLNKWEIARSNKAPNIVWENGRATGSVSDDGGMHVQPLYQVKAFLKKRKGVLEAQSAVEFFKSELAKIEPKTFAPVDHRGGKFMLEISIPDLHLGKLAWGNETGSSSYDSKEAVRLYKEAAINLIEKSPHDNLEVILLPIGNDFFNVDNHNATTTAGTPQSEDSRWQKTFTLGCSLLAEIAEYLKHYAPVQIIIVQGNHDYERSFYLGEYLSAWFRNCEDVKVFNGPTMRKYVTYGKNLIGFTHGNEEKLDALPLLMATEVKENWAETQFREIHLGHLHQEKLKEIQGVKIRHLPSLCATDAWHSKKGYVGNLRSAQSFLYSKDRGLEAIYYFNA